MAMNSRIIIIASAILGLVLLSVKTLINPSPVLIWNASESVPVGWYSVARRQPRRGEIAVMKPAKWVQIYAAARGYLPWNAWLLKPVAASYPSLICRFGQTIFIEGNSIAHAKRTDARHRFLPVWKGCLRLNPGQYFVMSQRRDSFDSRYFGPIEQSEVLGTALPLTDLLK
jgi:conjugative transfer signal peptidase TraF